MIHQVAFPVPVDQIPAELKRLEHHVIAIQTEIAMCQILRNAIRDGCPHPEASRARWSDYSGDSGTKCGHCGKELP